MFALLLIGPLGVTAVEGDTFNQSQPIEVFSTNDHGSITLNPVIFTSTNTIGMVPN